MVPALIGGPGQKEHDHLFWSCDELDGQRALLEWPWKLIHRNTEAQGAAASAEVLLFNLDTDPGEKINLAASNADVVRKLESKVQNVWRAP